MNTRRIALFTILTMLLALTLGSATAFANNGNGDSKVVGAFGIAGDKVVHVLVVVPPDGNANEIANNAVRAQGARPITKQEYSTISLFWDNFSDGDAGNDFVPVRYNGSDAPANIAGSERSYMTAAQQTWTAVSTSNFVFSDGENTGKCPSLVAECRGRQTFVGNNDVAWIDIRDPNTLGVTWSGTSIDEFDMALDNGNHTWYVDASGGVPPGAFDAQTVWLHEFGHALGLGHSAESGAVMEAYYGGELRTLSADDIAGVTTLYPASTSPTPTPTPTPEPTPTPTPDPGTTVSVASVTYATEGGKNDDKHLLITVALANDQGDPVSGASLSISVDRDGNLFGTGSGTTGTAGTVTFSSKNAPSGTYVTTVTAISAAGLTWDGTTPANSFDK